MERLHLDENSENVPSPGLFLQEKSETRRLCRSLPASQGQKASFCKRLDQRHKEHRCFPDLSKWFERPLLLNRGIYGLAASGKFWNEEFSEWLRAEDFHQSTADTTYFVKCYLTTICVCTGWCTLWNLELKYKALASK